MSNENKPDERAAFDDVKPLVDEWMRSRETCMDGAAYGAAIELAAFVAARATQQATTGDERAAFTSALILAICELPDRTSPEDEPGAMVANADEIAACVERACENAEVRIVPEATTPSPVAGSAGQAPKLAVWYGSMPESNGKSNWTAILHNGDIASGMTIDRSEYPDRVRYEADRLRWLIGDLEKEPFILDYDADKHSGYKAPTAPSLATDAGAVLTLKLAREIAAQCWCQPETSGIEMDARLAEAFARALLAAHPTEQRMSDAARDVLAERARQVSGEGWTPEHDDQYVNGELAQAASCYAHASASWMDQRFMPSEWPWDSSWWKPTTQRRNLEKAGALIIGEIERIDRAARKAEIERGDES
ncbi:hypothetical protein A6456_37735 [Paraburkholderia tropica]|nr:hypothetical protein A6456_37735 [Paraburkholderia tropica]